MPPIFYGIRHNFRPRKELDITERRKINEAIITHSGKYSLNRDAHKFTRFIELTQLRLYDTIVTSVCREGRERPLKYSDHKNKTL